MGCFFLYYIKCNALQASLFIIARNGGWILTCKVCNNRLQKLTTRFKSIFKWVQTMNICICEILFDVIRWKKLSVVVRCCVILVAFQKQISMRTLQSEIMNNKDSRSKSDNGQTNNDNSVDAQINPGSSSDRKRTLSSGAQKEDDIANEGKCTNKNYSSMIDQTSL